MAESTRSKSETKKSNGSGKKGKKSSDENRSNGSAKVNGSDVESHSGTDAGALLSKAKVPAAVAGAALIGAAGAATIRKKSGTGKKSGSRKGELPRKAAKTSNPVLTAAGSQARKLKKLVPGA